MTVSASHLLTNPGWLPHPPLVSVLAEALDGGQALRDNLRHPYRVPTYHPPEATQALSTRLDQIRRATCAAWPLPDDDWYRPEIGKVASASRHSATASEGIVGAPEPPIDHERGRLVFVPRGTP